MCKIKTYDITMSRALDFGLLSTKNNTKEEIKVPTNLTYLYTF